MLPSAYIFLLFLSLLLSSRVFSSTSTKVIAPESLQIITRFPCSEPKGRCSFKDFGELRGEKNFLDEWMAVLYFDFYDYSSHGLIAGILPGYIHVKLFRHKIIVGRVMCRGAAMQVAANDDLCKDMDPSVIYAFQNGRKTDYWYSVADLGQFRAFVIGNLLTLQYTSRMESVKGTDFDEDTRASWRSEPGSRKFLLVVHLAKAGLEVNETDYPDEAEIEHRMRAFDLVGAVVQTIPDVRIMIVSGVISKQVEFWWYDSLWCPVLEGPDCDKHHIRLQELSEKDSDDVLCEIEKFSAGLDVNKAEIDLLSDSTPRMLGESFHRLLLACPFLFYNAEGEKIEDLKRKLDSVVVYPRKYLVVLGNRKLALSTLSSYGADVEMGDAKILLKYHSEIVNQTNTDIFSHKTTAGGHQVEFITSNGTISDNDFKKLLNKVFLELHFTEDYDNLRDNNWPYQETDELSLILSSTKTFPSVNLVELNETSFHQRMAPGQPPATVLFYVHWSSSSQIARDVIFPSASKELASRFNLTKRLYAVDCFNWNEICGKQGIDHYPSVKFFVQGASRRLQSVVSLAEIVRETVLMDMGSVLMPNSKQEVESALNLTSQLMDYAVLGVDLEDARVIEEFKKTAETFKGKALFILAKQDNLPKGLYKRIPSRSIASFSARLRPDLILKDHNSPSLAHFVTEARFNRVMELTWVLYQEFRATKRPLLLLLVLEMTPQLNCLLGDIAVRRSGEFHITWLHTSHNTQFPIFKDVKEPTVVLIQDNSIHRWTVIPYKGESGRYLVGQHLDQWLEIIKQGKKSPDDFIKERKYPPEGLHINCVDNIYPRPSLPETSVKDEQVSDFPEEKIDISPAEATMLPKSTSVPDTRTEL